VSPFAGWLWRSEGDLRLEVHNMLSIVPGAGIGVYDRTAVTLGYATKECPACKGRMKLVAMITEPNNIARFLTALGEPSDVPGRSPNRGPPYWGSGRRAPQATRSPER
jgi:hypothetical protein